MISLFGVVFCLAEELKNNPIFEKNRMSMTARATNINPRGYQFGFIYNELDNTKTIAHELCHGAYHLRHTFDEADYLAPEGTTDNLMDYATANDRTFNHWQWQDIHQPKNVRFKWAQDEEGAEANMLPFIYWLGHTDFGGKYFSDELEDKIDDCLGMFKTGSAKRSKWINGVDKSIDNTYEEWSVEKNDIVPQIWMSIIKNKVTNINLKAKHVYSWAGNVVTSTKELNDIMLEEDSRFTYVNIYSFAEDTKLSNYKITDISDLRNSTRVKAGYYDWGEKFLIIVFFSEKGSLDMVIQIPTLDSNVALFAEDWVRCLLMSNLESETYNGPKTISELKDKKNLTPIQIKEIREHIKTLNEEEMSNWYLELQKHVPYHNQRNNTTIITKKDGTDVNIGDVMCNITCTAMALEMLGLQNPCAPDIEQFEDCIETKITILHTGTFKFKQLADGNKYNNSREYNDSRKSAIENMYSDKIEVGDTTCYMSNDIEKAKLYIIHKLKRGDGVIVSFGGHFIRIVSCDDDGYVYDDPYGAYSINDTKNSKKGWNAYNTKTAESGEGENNARKWSDFDVLTKETKFYIEYYHEK